jgi:hypothetical protein
MIPQILNVRYAKEKKYVVTWLAEDRIPIDGDQRHGNLTIGFHQPF